MTDAGTAQAVGGTAFGAAGGAARGSARALALLALPILLSACQTGRAGEAPLAADPRDSDAQAHALAQAACAGCHSVEPYGLSPDPAAPEFPTIANRRGLSVATLTSWLRNAHNYPEEMDFYLEDDEVAQLVNYILTLQTPGYEPPIQ